MPPPTPSLGTAMSLVSADPPTEGAEIFFARRCHERRLEEFDRRAQDAARRVERIPEALCGELRLRLLDMRPDIKLLFTDMGLPGGMNGRQLADEAKRRRPALRGLFTSGYTWNAIVHHGRLDPGVELLPKPYSFAALGTRVRRILDAQ